MQKTILFQVTKDNYFILKNKERGDRACLRVKESVMFPHGVFYLSFDTALYLVDFVKTQKQGENKFVYVDILEKFYCQPLF